MDSLKQRKPAMEDSDNFQYESFNKELHLQKTNTCTTDQLLHVNKTQTSTQSHNHRTEPSLDTNTSNLDIKGENCFKVNKVWDCAKLGNYSAGNSSKLDKSRDCSELDKSMECSQLDKSRDCSQLDKSRGCSKQDKSRDHSKLDKAGSCSKLNESKDHSKPDIVADCKPRNGMSVYKKRRVDAVSNNSSIRSALLDISPGWVKSFFSEPELLMNRKAKPTGIAVHRQSDSLFSTSSGFTNYRGLLNLCIILLVLSNARLFLENIIKYGILIDPIQWIQMFFEQPYSWPNVGIVLLSNVFILTSFYMEVALSKSWLSEKTAVGFQSALLILLLVIPAGVILYLHPNPMFSVVTLGMYSMLFLKLISYHSVNSWCRQASSPKRSKVKRSKSISVSSFTAGTANGKEETMIVQYPNNLNKSDMYYFMFAPTLCYELNFPRSLRVRKRFLLKRIIEMLFLSQLMMGCIQQWMVPTVQNSMKPLTDMNLFKSLERLLKLAIPNHFIWLMFFYWFFHSTLNVVAELLKFGDREFYSDWWNSDTVNDFWKNWNIPVHRWASRHLYKPLVRRGYSKLNGSIAVFFLSAFFHEYLLSVPLQMFRIWAFSAMLGQVPLALLQVKYMQGKYGNMVVWLSLILGQPVAVLAYFHDYYVNHAVTDTAGTAV